MRNFFSILTGTFHGSPPATRSRGEYSETLAGGQPGPPRVAPSAAFGRVARGTGSCGGCGSGGRLQRGAPGEQHIKRYGDSSSSRDGPKGETGKVQVVYNASKLLCEVLCIVRVYHRRG